MLVSQTHNTKCAESIAQKDNLALDKSQGHGNANIVVFRVRGTFWQEYFAIRRYMRQVIFRVCILRKSKDMGSEFGSNTHQNESKRI